MRRLALAILGVALVGCGGKKVSADDLKNYQLTTEDLKTFYKDFPKVIETFRNITPTRREIKEKGFQAFAEIDFPAQTKQVIKETGFQGLDHFLKVYSNVKLADIRLIAEKKIKEAEAELKKLDEALKVLEEDKKAGKLKEDQYKALKEQLEAQKRAIQESINALKPFAQLEVSQANLNLVKKYWADVEAALIKGNDWENLE